MKKGLFLKTLSVLAPFWALLLMNCAGSSGPGALQSQGVGSPAPVNQAAPIQVSGTSSPSVDPDPDANVFYKAKFETDSLENADDELTLKGTIERTKKDSPQLAGRVLKIIDRRTKHYVVALLEVKEGTDVSGNFETKIKAPALKYEELMTGKTLSFYVSPFVLQDSHSVELDKTEECETPWCIEDSWYLTPLKNPIVAGDPPPSSDNYSAPPPGGKPPPPGGPNGGRPPGELCPPGTPAEKCHPVKIPGSGSSSSGSSSSSSSSSSNSSSSDSANCPPPGSKTGRPPAGCPSDD